MKKDNNGRPGRRPEPRDVLADALDAYPWPHLFTLQQYRELVIAGYKTWTNPDFEAPPLVRLYTPDGEAERIITEINPYDATRAHGLTTIDGFAPDIGSIDLDDLADDQAAIDIQRDDVFATKRTLRQYAADVSRRRSSKKQSMTSTS